MPIDREIRPILEKVAARVRCVSGVEAIVLGGSRARGNADHRSDIDLGIYYNSRHPFRIADLERAAGDLDDRWRGNESTRHRRPGPAAPRHSPGLVTGFGEWGPGVNGGGWLQIDGMHVDFLYRDLVAVRRAIADCRAGNISSIFQLGHPLGFHCQIYPGELNCCIPIYDPRSTIRRLKRHVARYPEQMRRAMVTKHLFDATFYIAIAEKPARRGDVTYVAGCLFHAAGFMTLVMYALNREWLINEKGAIAASRSFKLKPRGFHSTIESVLANPGRTSKALSRSIERMRSLALSLRKCIADEGIEATGFGI